MQFLQMLLLQTIETFVILIEAATISVMHQWLLLPLFSLFFMVQRRVRTTLFISVTTDADSIILLPRPKRCCCLLGALTRHTSQTFFHWELGLLEKLSGLTKATAAASTYGKDGFCRLNWNAAKKVTKQSGSAKCMFISKHIFLCMRSATLL